MRSPITWMALSAAIALPAVATAQHAEMARPLPTPLNGTSSSPGAFSAATQIGRRLFVAGSFDQLADASEGAIVVDPVGQLVAGAFPQFQGLVTQIVADGTGGWFVVGEFTQVGGRPTSGFARVTPSRTIDDQFRVVADGQITKVAVGHGRVYLVGEFSTVRGVRRRGLAALDASGTLTSWAASFDPSVVPNDVTVSSIGVYVGALGQIWGLDASNGRTWFSRGLFFSGMAASSARVFLGSAGTSLPVRAIDPLTGGDIDWRIGLTFQPVRAPYGQDGTEVTALMLDGARLYVGGRFLTTDGRQSLLAVDAATGAALPWRPAAPPPDPNSSVWLSKVGPIVAATFGSTGEFVVYDGGSAATIPFRANTIGTVRAAAPAPEGAVLGGSFASGPRVPRAGLAAIDLDTFAVDGWTAAVASTPFDPIVQLATDGTWLFARTEGTLGGSDARIYKIDPTTGAAVAQQKFPSVLTRMTASGGELLVSTTPRDGSPGHVGSIAVATWAYQALPAAVFGSISDLGADATTIYVAGQFADAAGQPTTAGLRAIDRATGDWNGWRPAFTGRISALRLGFNRVWVAGEFRQIGGARRRGLAALDPITGAATAWDPDVAGLLSVGPVSSSIVPGVAGLEVDVPSGLVYASAVLFDDPRARTVAHGQVAASILAYDAASGTRLPFRPMSQRMLASTPDCLLVGSGCLSRAEPAPSGLQVAQSGAVTTLSWTLPASSARTGVRVEFGATEGRADLATIDLPAAQSSFTVTAPPGSYFARVRALAASAASLTTPDVSFAVGAPAAPLNVTATSDRTTVSLGWDAPTTGAPQTYELQAGSAPGRADYGAIALSGASTSFSIANVPVSSYWLRLLSLGASGARSVPGNEVFVDLRPVQTCSVSPPQQLAATVAGRVVTLTWQPPADGSEDIARLVVGSGPGLSDLATVDMAPYATAFAVTAPPGTYYARLVTGCFTTAASNEVRIDVP